MKIFLWSNIIFCALHVQPTWTAHYHTKETQKGEYYEYDLEGSRGEKALREFGHHTKQVINAPFKFVGKCYHTTKGAIQGTLHSIEAFLSDSGSIDGRRHELKKAFADFEGSGSFQDYYRQEQDVKHQCMFGLPASLWKIFKNVLYTAGFQFPRATVRAMKGIFSASCLCQRLELE